MAWVQRCSLAGGCLTDTKCEPIILARSSLRAATSQQTPLLSRTESDTLSGRPQASARVSLGGHGLAASQARGATPPLPCPARPPFTCATHLASGRISSCPCAVSGHGTGSGENTEAGCVPKPFCCCGGGGGPADCRRRHHHGKRRLAGVTCASPATTTFVSLVATQPL